MGSLTIRNLDDAIKTKLRVRAARNGRSMEEEARTLLKAKLDEPERPGRNFLLEAHERFAALGGFEMPEMSRGSHREPPSFEE